MASTKLYVGIWAILVVATILEVATRILPGTNSTLITIIILIASAKAIIIALYYQHLRYEGIRLAVLPLAAIVALAFLAITAIISLGMGGM
jgi:cytochrome c oxidase subunit IV